MRLPPADRLFPRLAAGAFLALAPKCLWCAAAYAGFGAALGLGGPEICGATPEPPVWPAMLGVMSCATLWFAARRHHAGVKFARPARPLLAAAPPECPPAIRGATARRSA
jgi:hypothetical protein